jgi:hypothetical protein
VLGPSWAEAPGEGVMSILNLLVELDLHRLEAVPDALCQTRILEGGTK